MEEEIIASPQIFPASSSRWGRLRLILAVVCAASGAFAAGAGSIDPPRASSAIHRETNGTWLFVDGKRKGAVAGAVYQRTQGNTHIRAYQNSMYDLYRPLDNEVDGGDGHGAKLAKMGIDAIRVYELPVENEADAERVKGVFRRLFHQHGIKVLIGDWAGLHTGMDFRDARDLARLHTHMRKLVATYAEEKWVLGWQVGNENNYHIHNGVLGTEISMDAPGYYKFMDELAGIMKEQLTSRYLKQFISLGHGDLKEEDARMISAMTNIDAVGLNCYREEASGLEEVIRLAAEHLRMPIYFAEIGWPASNRQDEEKQSQFLKNAFSIAFSHGAGRVRTGRVIGAFVHEATDESWKRNERGRDQDSHYGVLGKMTEGELGRLLNQNRDFNTWVLPGTDKPDDLINSAWNCLEGPYARKHGRDYGYALAYAGRVINIYQEVARTQQSELTGSKAPPGRAASADYWALNTVGTGFFIMGDAWMLLSYDLKGAEPPLDPWRKVLQLADVRLSQPTMPAEVIPTNSAGCLYYAQQIFATLRTEFPDAHLREINGNYWRLDRAIESRFPELLPEMIPLTWRNCLIFVASGVGLTVGFALLSRWTASRRSVKSRPALGWFARFVLLLALVFNLVCLFWLLNWWFHPVRAKYYTVQPFLYVMLSAIGGLGVMFYFYIWHLLWNMRRPVPMPPKPGHKVAMVTTRVASEPVESLEKTLQKLIEVKYPHDTYLLDEENNPDAAARCRKWNAFHFSRKGISHYNQPTGKFQARTKGGNLNSWLYEHGANYEFVAFLDPDHRPRPEFLDKVLGYFENENVGFVQGPQVFHNRSDNWVARGAAEQSYFFYGPIEMGLFGIGACVVNGSHSTFRVSDLLALPDKSYAVHDADDILTSMRLHALKKTGVYVPEVIAEGLAPDTWDEFSKQQRRWAYSMFHLLFHFYPRELLRMPLHCKAVYMVLTAFYFRGVAFAGLLMLPFISALTGNPAVNANLAGFCLRYLPFFALHYGIILFLGQRFLIQRGSRRGFWFRGGMLWVAMWWDHLCALWKGFWTRRVTDRVVAAKWKTGTASPWRAVRPHIFLAISALAVIAWTCLQSARLETVWGSLIFLGVIALSQGFIIFKLTRKSKETATVSQAVSEPPPRVIVRTVYLQQPRKT